MLTSLGSVVLAVSPSSSCPPTPTYGRPSGFNVPLGKFAEPGATPPAFQAYWPQYEWY
jgi:hypothetical protein